MTGIKTKAKGLVPARTIGTKPKPRSQTKTVGETINLDGGFAHIDEGLPHQRRNAARGLAAALTEYADTILL